jgi:hypothetical protein
VSASACYSLSDAMTSAARRTAACHASSQHCFTSLAPADGTLAAGVGLTGYYIYAFASPVFAADDSVLLAAT